MNIKRYIGAMIIFIIIIMTAGGCSFGSVENESSSKVNDINKTTESAVENESSEVHTSDTKYEDENSMNDLDNGVEIRKDIDVEQEKIELSSERQREINIFLSNFTEVFFPDFDGDLSNEILIDFGVRHNDINNFNAIKVKDSYGFLDKSVVERSVKRFFNLRVQHQKTTAYDFDGNNYIIRLASGGPVHMAVVQEMYDNKDGSYTVYFDEVFSNELIDYSITPQKLKEEIDNNSDIAEIVASKKAIVKRHDFEGKSPYKLLKYVTISN